MGRRPDGSVVTGHYVDDLKGETGQAHGLSQNKSAKVIAVARGVSSKTPMISFPIRI